MDLTLPQGKALISNPLDATPTNDLNSIMPFAPDGTVVHRFDASGQTSKDGMNFFAGYGWRALSGNTNDPALILNPSSELTIRLRLFHKRLQPILHRLQLRLNPFKPGIGQPSINDLERLAILPGQRVVIGCLHFGQQIV